MKKTMRAYFMVDDLTHLQRGGRLSSAQALIGGLLQVKPVLHFQEKVIVPFEKIRTRKKAMKRIADLLAEDAAKMPLEAAIIHGNCPKDAAIWLEELSAQLPDVEFTISHFGPVIGTHLGEGAMGLGWVKEKSNEIGGMTIDKDVKCSCSGFPNRAYLAAGTYPFSIGINQ